VSESGTRRARRRGRTKSQPSERGDERARHRIPRGLPRLSTRPRVGSIAKHIVLIVVALIVVYPSISGDELV